MFNKDFFTLRKTTVGLFSFALVLKLASAEALAQSSLRTHEIQTEGFSWWIIILFVLVGCLAVAVYFRYKSRNAEEVPAAPYKKVSYSNEKQPKSKSDRKAEWQKKNQTARRSTKASLASPGGFKVKQNGHSHPDSTGIESIDDEMDVLPIHSFLKVKPASSYDPLTVSNDPALLSAIEQVREEFEDDEEIRTLALRVLAAFKTSNSIEALAQIALYDLSSNQRSAAVTTLSEFDHESVFETILLACADPTREVRAAAARALFQLTFDRAEAWTRIANLKQQGRIVQMARAAIEADLVERSFERLVHPDKKYAYEAFALVTLLIKAGEMEVVADYLKKTRDSNVRHAILHTIKVSKNKKGIDELKSLLKTKDLSPDLREEVDRTIEEMGFVTV